MRPLGVSPATGKWKGQLSIANIERIEKGLMMEQGGIIDIERDFADETERVLTMFVIEDPNVLRHEAAERIECQVTD